ncbi:MAG: spore coat protein H [Bradymonadia bacterium]
MLRPFRIVSILALLALTACGPDDVGLEEDAIEIGPPNDAILPDTTPDLPDELPDVADAEVDTDVREPPLYGLLRVDVLISNTNLNAIHRDPLAEVEVSADFVVDGVRYDDGEIEVHGGYARTVPKLSYRIRFQDDELLETTLFSEGEESHRRVVLQASWIDPTYMRNCLTLDLVRELGGFAPRCDYVELFFNGHYHGLYVAIERVDEHFLRRNGLAEDGLVLKASSNLADWSNVSNPMAGFEMKLNIDAPTDGLSELIRHVQQTPQEYESFVAGVEPWVDLDDFMSWQLAHTLADNRDTFTKNYYLHYDWEAGDAPFRIVSWDADATWGLNWDGAAVDPEVRDALWGNDAFSPRLFSIPEYLEPYRERYRTLMVDGQLEEWVRVNVGHRTVRIEEAAERDLFAWDRSHDFDDERDYLDASIDARFDTLSTVLE